MAETWVIKDDAPIDEASLALAATNISFTTNDQKATGIGITSYGLSYFLTYGGGIGNVANIDPGVSNSFAWVNEAYKTLKFDTAPTGNLLTWLQANAVKQQGKNTNKVVVNGETILDLTQDTVTPATLAKGIKAHDKSGARITGEYVPLDTSDATVTADDMSYGVVAYGKNGKVYGTTPTIDSTSEKALEDSTVGFHGGLGKIQLSQRIPSLGMLFREGSTVILRASPSDFGNATAADVAKGKTFTSAAGLKVEGTMETGGGGGSGGRPQVNLTITVDPTGAPEGWVVDVLGAFGSLYTLDANSHTVTIPDWTSGDMFVVVNSSMEPSTSSGYLDGDNTECVNCYFDMTGFAADYVVKKSDLCLYACQIESGLSAGAEATMTIKFY